MRTRHRSQAERDETTVGIGYALLSACFLGVVVFAAIAGPAAVWHLPHAVGRFLQVTGASVAAILAAVRIVHVLRRHAALRG
ncbi:DUF6332 family protein [Streptomyces sp. IBSBF 2435]|uniref:DUF6332 family protein n=1 Tax=Streptomyces sp. IBSBF 2435 TaxID=2903531 RepID=UPI002FDBD6B9